ncbi:hypothetical protein [Luteolibacter sp.]|uniref:hypothetical protein n=2 Tax=Luteolibacter sp. TaxID=1962973 RepID=UPI003263745D
MKTKSMNQIVVKDGKSKIANWTQEFEHRPTVGDRVGIPADVAKALKGYQSEATVSLVEMDQQTGDFHIVLEAECNLPADQRPVVTLNASLLPDRIHDQVENLVRQRLEMPVLEWEDSSETTPIIRFHPFQSQPRTPLATLQKELREILNDAVKLAPC